MFFFIWLCRGWQFMAVCWTMTMKIGGFDEYILVNKLLKFWNNSTIYFRIWFWQITEVNNVYPASGLDESNHLVWHGLIRFLEDVFCHLVSKCFWFYYYIVNIRWCLHSLFLRQHTAVLFLITKENLSTKEMASNKITPCYRPLRRVKLKAGLRNVQNVPRHFRTCLRFT